MCIAATELREGDPRGSVELVALRDALADNASPYRVQTLQVLSQAYAAVATKLGEGDPRGAEVLASLRDAITKTADTEQPQLQALSEGYAAVARKLVEGDPRDSAELAQLREAMAKTTTSYRLDALSLCYAAVAIKLREGDPSSADELAALRNAIVKSRESNELLALSWRSLGNGGQPTKGRPPGCRRVARCVKRSRKPQTSTGFKITAGLCDGRNQAGQGDLRGGQKSLKRCGIYCSQCLDPNRLQAFARAMRRWPTKCSRLSYLERTYRCCSPECPRFRLASRAGHSQRLSTRPYGQEGQRFPGIK